MLQRAPGGPLEPHIHLGHLQDQNLPLEKLELGKQNVARAPRAADQQWPSSTN